MTYELIKCFDTPKSFVQVKFQINAYLTRNNKFKWRTLSIYLCLLYEDCPYRDYKLLSSIFYNHQRIYALACRLSLSTTYLPFHQAQGIVLHLRVVLGSNPLKVFSLNELYN